MSGLEIDTKRQAKDALRGNGMLRSDFDDDGRDQLGFGQREPTSAGIWISVNMDELL